MKKSLFQKVICLILSVTTLFGFAGISVAAASSSERGYSSNNDTASSIEEMQALVGTQSYEAYLNEKTGLYWELVQQAFDAKKKLPTPVSIKIDITKPSEIDGDTSLSAEQIADLLVSNNEVCQDAMKADPDSWVNFGGSDVEESSIYLPSRGSVAWTFNIPDGATGFYNIKLEYYTCITSESSISTVERKLFFGNLAPFDEARYIKLDKSWQYTNIEVSDPVPTDEEDSSSTRYETRKNGYFKIVTVIKDGFKTETTYTLTQDINGNSMAPGIEQSPSWNTYYCQDSTGYYQGEFFFFLENGTRTIKLGAQREPVIIKSIELVPYELSFDYDSYEEDDADALEAMKSELKSQINMIKPENDSIAGIPSYSEVKQSYADNGYTTADGKMTVIQAEFPDFVSDASVYPTNDKTSSATYPSTSKAQLYNVIGKNSYNSLGQWAAYKFTVDSTGLYKLSMRYLQSALQGMYICRTIKLSGGDYGLSDGTPTVPFAEAYDTQFAYSKNWQSKFLGDSKGNIFEFYFEEGVEYTLYVECSLGSLKNLIQRVENSLAAINSCYLRILQLTGASPDEYRDYNFLEIMPDVLVILAEQAAELESVRSQLHKLCGTNGSHIATLETVAILLDEMSRNDGYNIASNMSNLKSYLGTLGTWINDSKKGTLIIDSISICPLDTTKSQLPKTKANFFKSVWFEIKSFFYSFFTDYDKMGVTDTSGENDVSIDVWLAMGRDQSNIWRSMIDAQDGFTAKTGNAVNLKLVTGGTLLPSILSGKGPDVYMGLGAATVINYAIRDAIMGVSGTVPDKNYNNELFNNTYYTYKVGNKYVRTETYTGDEGLTFVSLPFDQYVEENFVDAAMDTLTLLDVSYGLPQTMAFSMMFYRMDILAQLNQEVPETWDELLSMLPVLQSNNMSIGISYVLALDFMLYQQGGNMWKYTDNPEYAGSEINLDTTEALDAFEYVCRLYSDYSFPISYDAANRFRTGEMPLLVGSYEDLYNKLVVYATEIEGLWEFSPLPGCPTYDEAGNIIDINYNSIANVTATVMLHGCEGKEQIAAWEFMQWQTSADVQASYGNKMVALIGPSAKYETANINAIDNLSWTADERDAIKDQIDHMSSIVNYPGSYYIARYIKFAFLDAVNEGADPHDALSGYIDAINAEITRKREEFGLKTGAPPS